ncbi:hypothetical protein Leryth_004592 [Lithospermum erythrorhizon]|nr:hypothetical protein Leryth_004592 [Lithospermum erythrorhizon]
MKMRNKGKVHPSPTSSAASPSSSADIPSILNLLPTTILTLLTLLSLQDKEVLAYMITRSLKTTINPLNILEEKTKKNQTLNSKTNKNIAHKAPMFDCECFDCYTNYWSKWNSSSNRELIHQAIEAFEEHLNTTNEVSLLKNKGRNKKRDKMGKKIGINLQPENQELSPENQESSPENFVLPEKVENEVVSEVVAEAAQPVKTAEMAAVGGGGSSHKGLARKVLPDVLGLFNSRLWSLWGPNV